MVSQNKNQTIESSEKRNVNEDYSGRDKLVSNVFFSWAGHFVFIVAGFIMPRLIDDRLGRDLLGVWDFAWSIVSYFNLIDLGIGGSVSRYVARYRMSNDMESVNRTVSSATFILGVSGLLIFIMTIFLSLLLPWVFGKKLGENTLQTQWIVLFLGADVAVQIGFGAFSGVLMGCHKWKLVNILTSTKHAAILAGMIIALIMGFGLITLSLIFLIGETLSRVIGSIMAYQICPKLKLRFSFIGLKTVQELYVFGGKSLIPMISRMLLMQTTSVFILAYLSPAALALYSRPFSLIRHIEQLVMKIAAVVRPTAGSLQSAGDMQSIRKLLLKSVGYSFYMVLPMLLIIIFYGDAIMQLWMGSDYANLLIPAILAIGSLAYLGQTPAVQILAGLNAHGRAGLAHLIASIISAILVIFTLKFFKLGLVGAALSVTIPMALMNIIYLPQLVCRKVGLPMKDYLLSIMAGPIKHILPYVFCLAVARIIFRSNPLFGLLYGGLSGSLVLCVIYYLYVLPERIKKRIFNR